ncbi:MAG: hypothetical protein GYA16_13155, partial [Spirochaetes bacterium]|nr:hypothetical protein [Spirochaetota bacterium]
MKKILIIISVSIISMFTCYNASYAQKHFSVQQLIDNALRSFELLKAQQVKIDELEALKKYNTQWKNPEIAVYYGSKSIDSQKGHVSGIAVT